MSLIMQVNELNFSKEVKESPYPVLVDFWAKWCGPCRSMDDDLERLAAAYRGQFKIVRLDVDENRSLAIQFRITCLPTLMVFCGGRIEERLTGCMPFHTLENIVKRNLLELAVA